MKSSFLRPALAALLPALLTLASCGKSDPAPAPDQGRILFVHAASNVNTVGLKFSVDNAGPAALNYGQSSSYQSVKAGSVTVQVMAGTQTAASQAVTVEKNKMYSFFATPSGTTSTVNTLLVADDLTAPGTGKARIRVINLSQDVPTSISLAQVASTVNGPIVTSVVDDVEANTSSKFFDFTPGIYSLSIVDNADKVVAEVGDGSGSGGGTKKYEEGRLYTVVVTGTQGSLTPEQKIRVFVSQNN